MTQDRQSCETGSSNSTDPKLPTTFIVDTNAFGSRLGTKMLGDLQELCGKGVRVLVPDVVCLELASHDWESVEKPLARMNNLGIISAQNWVVKIEDRIQELITNTGAEILKTTNQMYERALRAQILKEAPASPKTHPEKPKERVTTGAVDYIIFLHAQEHANADSPVCVLTGDKILKSSLSTLQGVLLQDSISDANTIATYQRLPLSECVQLLNKLRTPSFAKALLERARTSGYDQASFVGAADLFRLDSDRVLGSLYVATTSVPLPGAEWWDAELVQFKVTLTNDLSIESMVAIDSDGAPYWPHGSVPSIDIYLNTELSMVPSVVRPVAEMVGQAPGKDAGLTYLRTESEVVFRMNGEEFARLTWHEFDLKREMNHEGSVWIHEESRIDVQLHVGTSLVPADSKGDLARLMVDQIIKNDSAELRLHNN